MNTPTPAWCGCLTHPYISFQIWWESEQRYDGASFQYSLDDGITWINVGSVNDPDAVAAALVATGKLQLARADHALPEMIRVLLPVGIRGLVVAGFLAALMSSLSSLFNSCSTLFTVDIYEKLRPGQSPQHLLKVGRIATTVVVVLGIIWIPVMERGCGGGAGRARGSRGRAPRAWSVRGWEPRSH